MSLSALPYDLLFNIAQYLAIDDIHHLQAVSIPNPSYPVSSVYIAHSKIVLDHRPANRFGRSPSLDPSTVRLHMAYSLALGPCLFPPSNASRTFLPKISSRRSTEHIVLKGLGGSVHLVPQGPHFICRHHHPPHQTNPVNGTQRYPRHQTKRSIGYHRLRLRTPFVRQRAVASFAGTLHATSVSQSGTRARYPRHVAAASVFPKIATG